MLTLNGKTREFAELVDGATLAELFGVLTLKSDRVAVERNGEIVSRALWNGCALRSGDRLEVVHFVGGGSACPG